MRHHNQRNGNSDSDGKLMPIRYVKIVPLLSWGASFNFSIWYVELLGLDDPFYVCDSLRTYNMVRELELVRMCLKHFRQQGYADAFRALQKETGVQLEDDTMTDLYHLLVKCGNFEDAERMLRDFVDGEFVVFNTETGIIEMCYCRGSLRSAPGAKRIQSRLDTATAAAWQTVDRFASVAGQQSEFRTKGTATWNARWPSAGCRFGAWRNLSVRRLGWLHRSERFVVVRHCDRSVDETAQSGGTAWRTGTAVVSQDAVRSGESEYFRTRPLFGRIEPEARPNECESTTIELSASV